MIQRLLFIGLLFLGLRLGAEDLIVRTQLTPETVWVGQCMQLQIDVLGKNGWAQIADLSELEIPGSYVRPAGNSRVRLNETIGGESYSGQRYELAIYPQRPGTQTLPSIELSVKVQTWGAQNSTETTETLTQSIPFTTEVPLGADPTLPLIVSADFEASQKWEPDQTEFEIGDAVKRIITMRAEGLPAMVLPPLIEPSNNEFSLYYDTPKLKDEDRFSTREESATIVFERSLVAEAPSYQVQWWNPKLEKLELIALPGRTLSVAGSATPNQVTEATPDERRLSFSLLILTATLLTLSGLYFFKPKQASEASKEKQAFKGILSATKRDDPTQTLNALIAWLRLIDERPSHFFQLYMSPDLRNTADQLLKDPHTTINLHELAVGLRNARKAMHHQQRKSEANADALLPPLNLVTSKPLNLVTSKPRNL